MKTRENIFLVMDEALTMMDGALKALKGSRNTHPDARQPRRRMRDFSGDEKAIAELRRLSPAAKQFLNHHVRNVLSGVISYCCLEKPTEAQEAAMQLIDLLESFAPTTELQEAIEATHKARREP